MKRIVVLTGAGISAESGLKTFRGSDGLWEGHDVMDVASPIGWNQLLVPYSRCCFSRLCVASVGPSRGATAVCSLQDGTSQLDR